MTYRILRFVLRLVCRVRGHDPVRMSVGPNWMDVCLRCHTKLEVHEEV